MTYSQSTPSRDEDQQYSSQNVTIHDHIDTIVRQMINSAIKCTAFLSGIWQTHLAI